MDVATLLLEHKANVNITDKFGDTCLIFAARYNHVATDRGILQVGADLAICGYEGKTAAEWAKEKGHCALAEDLDATLRFDPSARDEQGQLYRVKDRCLRTFARDLKENAGFDDHMLDNLARFCTGKR